MAACAVREVSLGEFETEFYELVAEVERGGQVTVTRDGHPIARLVGAPLAKQDAVVLRMQVSATIAALREHRKGVALNGDVGDLIVEARD